MRLPLPDGASPEAVAAGVNPGMASWLPLRARQAEAGKLTTVLILGVTGMSGFLAAQNARLLGAPRVVGAGRSRPGLDRAAAAGAEPVALTGDRDTDAEALATVLGGDAPGLVLDFVWGSVAETAVPSALLRSRKLTISGSGAGSIPAAEIKAQLPRYLQLIADGSVQVPFRTFPLSDVASAWTASAESGPRVVLVRD